MAALVRELNFATMSRSEISSSLYNTIEWKRIQSAGVFLSADNEKLLEKAQKNLEVCLDSADETNSLVNLYLQIAENCTFDLAVQIYIFTRIEEIFGLGTAGNSGSNVSSGASSPVSPGRSGAGVRSPTGGSVLAEQPLNPYGARHVIHFTRNDGSVADSSFLRAMTNPNQFLQSSAALSLAYIFSSLYRVPGTSTSRMSNGILGPVHGLETLLNWTHGKLKAAVAQPNTLPGVLPSTVMLANGLPTRLFLLKWEFLPLVHTLLTKLGVTGNPQFLYELSLCMWTFSLVGNITHLAGVEANIAAETTRMFHTLNVAKTEVDMLSAAPSRKVVRMIVATLHNLARTEDDDILVDIFGTNCLRHLEVMIANKHHKNSGDVEFENDVKGLLEMLQTNYKELSTFDRYTTELQSGDLQWGILHTEKFWKENNRFMELNDWKLLKLLISYLSHTDSRIVSIALYDLGEFTRFFPNGRLIAKSLGGKDLALSLIQSEHEDVQRQALQCVSKIMVQSWNMLSSKA